MPRGAGGGRPKVADATLKKFLRFIREGNSIRAAAGSSGMGQQTYYKLAREADADRKDGRKTKLVKFMDSFERARADAETMLAKVVHKSALGDKKLQLPPNTADARFMLAHINSKRWADRARIDFHGDPPLDRAELMRGVQELAKAVRDEVEDPLILARIDARWEDIIEGWKGRPAKKRPFDDDEIIVDEPKLLTATNGNGEHHDEPESPAAQ
jgi:hypothetical protein